MGDRSVPPAAGAGTGKPGESKDGSVLRRSTAWPAVNGIADLPGGDGHILGPGLRRLRVGTGSLPPLGPMGNAGSGDAVRGSRLDQPSPVRRQRLCSPDLASRSGAHFASADLRLGAAELAECAKSIPPERNSLNLVQKESVKSC